MPSLKDIRVRIASVKNTRKITSAMKMVSAAKLRRAQEAAENARPYAVKMAEVIGGLASKVDPSKHPLLEQRDSIERALIVVITSDRGLCGGYNSNIFRRLEKHIVTEGVADITFDIATVGRKGSVYFRNHKLDCFKDYEDVIGNVSFEKAHMIAQEVTDAFIGGKYDQVFLMYNEFVSAIQYNTKIEQLLPLSIEDIQDEEASVGEYLFEPDEAKLLDMVLPTNVDIQVLSALFEAGASEHGSRMAAMDAATTNATDMIGSLTLQYNRARQAYITKELVEIVSGAEALNG